MAYTVPRPKLTFAERIYLPSIIAGLAITFKHLRRMLTGRTCHLLTTDTQRRSPTVIGRAALWRAALVHASHPDPTG